MAVSDKAQQYHERMFPGYTGTAVQTDPEFIERFDNFAFDEVVNTGDLDEKTRWIAILAVLMGCQGIDEFKMMAGASMNFGVTPIEIKEIVYQGTAYLGIGRTIPFLGAVNEIFTERGIAMPLEGQATTTMDTRMQAGEEKMVEAIGEKMKGFSTSGPEERRHINEWLSGNCFGDYYTRNGLDLKQREMITFCFLAGQGGCEPQLTSHARTNIRLGNDRTFLIQVVEQCLPYIGYPRSLNAMRCVDEASK